MDRNNYNLSQDFFSGEVVDNEENNNSEIQATNINNFGSPMNAFNFRSDIHYLTIIGNIEGHGVLPPQNKTTKYEHILPQLIAVEENPNPISRREILNSARQIYAA